MSLGSVEVDTDLKLKLVDNVPKSTFYCHTRPQLTNSTQINSAQLMSWGHQWHYYHLPVRPYAKLYILIKSHKFHPQPTNT